MEKNFEEIKEELRLRISRCNRIVTELENNQAFKEVLDDFRQTKQRIDDNWHLISDPRQLEEMRITKLATVSLINTIETYKHDLNRAQEELIKLENPESLINKDYDTE